MPTPACRHHPPSSLSSHLLPHTADDLFILTLFANNVPPALTNLNGSGTTGTAAFTLPPASLNLPALDLRFIIQAITVDGRNNITGLSPRVDVVVRL